MRALAVPFVVVLLLVFPVYCHALYCGNKIISEGDKLAGVVEKCGPPFISEKSSIELIKRYGPVVVRNEQIKTAFLLYDFGPNAFVKIMKFEDEKLIEIITAEYGGKREADPANCVPPEIGVSVGDNMAHVRYRCGSPYLVETPEEITENIGPIDDYYLFVKKQVVEWSYRLEKENFLSVLRFDNGILTIMYKKDLDQE